MLRKLAALVLAPALLLGGLGAARATSSGDPHAGSFVTKANAERRARGLAAYVVKGDLAGVAARHSARMAQKNSLYHNPRLGSEVSGWQVVGENVGSGGSVESIHAAFMNSPKHRANILARDYTEIGVATVTDGNGVIWVTQVFRLPYRAAAPKAQPPVRREVPRTVVRVPVQRQQPVARPRAVPPVAVPVPVPVRVPARPAPVPTVDRPDAAAFATALAPSDTAVLVSDPFAVALDYTETLAALAR